MSRVLAIITKVCTWPINSFILIHADVKNCSEETPLHLACELGRKDVVSYLVEEAKCDISELIKSYTYIFIVQQLLL